MQIVQKNIEEYCIEKSHGPSALCEELATTTRENHPMARMLIGPLEGSFLGFLIRLGKVKKILEVGTFTGYSALVMAEQLPEDGKVVTLDINDETVAVGRRFWERSDHGKKIHSIIGPALETMNNLNEKFDMIFIDADKLNYKNYLLRGLELLNEGGFIAVDNCLWSGQVLEQNSAEENTKAIQELNNYIAENTSLKASLLPVRDGIFVVSR